MVNATNKSFREIPLVHHAIVTGWDVLGIIVTSWAAFLLRFDGVISPEYREIFWQILPVFLASYVGAFLLFRIYNEMWSYFSADDLVKLGKVLAVGTAAAAVAIYATRGWTFTGFPISVIPLEFLLLGSWMTTGRFAARYRRERRLNAAAARGAKGKDGEDAENLLILGKREDVDLLMRASHSSGIGKVVAIVTDSPADRNLTMHGIKVEGTIDEVGEVARRTGANVVLVLPPFNRQKRMSEIIMKCAFAKAACRYRMVPLLTDFASGQLKASAIRDVKTEDLLGRKPVNLDRTKIRGFVSKKRVMVSGAGGTIGSEICRQVAAFSPEILVLYELSEIALYTIERELQRGYPNLKVIACVGDVRDEEQIAHAFESAGGIDIVYHSAGLKHVPLMEDNVAACFRTNLLGSHRLASVAVRYGASRFVMISTDKAVRPTSIMGGTKRMAERIVQQIDAGDTTFVSVRFGNVLGSSGSVIPLFKKQIAAGGPVTVTSENMIRFFMSIPEAVDLVLMAGTMGENGDIMVLEMGEQTKIIDLARRMIELSGLVPDEDIKIKIVGLRPGEKEYEEVITADENVVQTDVERIWTLRKDSDAEDLPPVNLETIKKLIRANDAKGLRQYAAECIPENHFYESPAFACLLEADEDELTAKGLTMKKQPDDSAEPEPAES